MEIWVPRCSVIPVKGKDGKWELHKADVGRGCSICVTFEEVESKDGLIIAEYPDVEYIKLCEIEVDSFKGYKGYTEACPYCGAQSKWEPNKNSIHVRCVWCQNEYKVKAIKK